MERWNICPCCDGIVTEKESTLKKNTLLRVMSECGRAKLPLINDIALDSTSDTGNKLNKSH